MLTSKSLCRSDRGATAIEYAIIAALIGIGLIASLVSTRGSLSSIFGVASGQMASSDAGAAPSAALGPRAPYWQAKTLTATTNGVNGNGPYTTYTYADGSYATLTKWSNNAVDTYLEVWDPNQPLRELYTIDANGVNNGIQIENRAIGASNAMGATLGTIYSASITNGVVARTGCSGDGCYAGNLDYLISKQPLVASDLQYFQGMTPKIGG